MPPGLVTVWRLHFRPALKVLSTTFPESTCFSLVRTKAGPLPGFDVLELDYVRVAASSLSTAVLRSFVVATVAEVLLKCCFGPRKPAPVTGRAVPGRDGE